MSVFREEILDHYKHPRNFGVLPDATVHEVGDNVPCGDRIEIALQIEHGVVHAIKFQGEGCALSVAATSMLTEMVSRSTLADIDSLSEPEFISHMVPGGVTPGRVACVVLGLRILKKARAHAPSDDRHALRHAADLVAPDMNLGEVAARWPAARSVLLDYGLHCVGCFASSFDTIEAGGKVHGMSDEEIGEMVKEINRAIQKK